MENVDDIILMYDNFLSNDDYKKLLLYIRKYLKFGIAMDYETELLNEPFFNDHLNKIIQEKFDIKGNIKKIDIKLLHFGIEEEWKEYEVEKEGYKCNIYMSIPRDEINNDEYYMNVTPKTNNLLCNTVIDEINKSLNITSLSYTTEIHNMFGYSDTKPKELNIKKIISNLLNNHDKGGYLYLKYSNIKHITGINTNNNKCVLFKNNCMFNNDSPHRFCNDIKIIITFYINI